jgi:MtrB/PioB family decaheme-associated outer membrane protein
MQRKLLSVLIAGLFVAAPAGAQNLGSQWVAQGEVSLGGILVDDDTRDGSKLEQYRDLGDGVLSSILYRGRNPGTGYWVDFFGENFGRDDMYINLRGGQYDAFKYRVYTDWLTQNRVFGARTPYSGAGSGELRATFPQSNPATWGSIDIGFDRRDTGGYFEWQKNSPWYFRVDASYVERDGTKIGSAANGTSPGNGFVDLAIPVDYKTTNASAEFGYNTSQYHFAVNYMVSTLDSGFKTVTWTNPYFGPNGIDTTYLAPDNDYQRLALNGTIRQLPWNSTLAARFTWDQLESDTPLATTAIDGTGGLFRATNPNVSDFHGKVNNTTFSVNWAALPVNTVDTRVYYNYQKRDNESTHVVFSPASTTSLACGGPCENELYSYEKWNVGFDAFWRFARGNRVGGGIEYQDLEHNRIDYDKIEDTKLFLEYRNTMVDGLAFRLKYTYLDRDANFLLGHEGANANDPIYIERFVNRYDVQPLERNEVKAILDWTPSPVFDFSVEAIWKENDYKRGGPEISYAGEPIDEFLGRTKDKRKELYVSASFGDPGKIRATAFYDIEWITYDSFHRNIGAGSCPVTNAQGQITANNCFDPSTPPNSTAYNWSAKNKDKNWSAGVGVDWPVLANVLLKASYLYVKTDGKADIVSQNNFGSPLPITAYDDTKTQSFNLKAIWNINRNWSMTAGYAYEKYEYSDDQYNGYQYTVPASSNQTSYLNGFNAFADYKANIFYLVGSYRF